MDIIIEIFIELYMELMLLIVPKKRVTKKQKVLAAVLACFVALGVLAMFVIGCGMIVDSGKWQGCLLIGGALIISIAQIAAGIVLYCRKNHK